MRRRWAAVALMVAAVLAWSGTGIAAASPAGFGVPVKLLGGQLLHGMDMGVDAAGKVHLVASGIRGTTGGLWYVTNRTGPWTVQRVATWSAGSVWIDPVIAVRPKGWVYIGVARMGCVACTVAPAKGVFVLSDAYAGRHGEFSPPGRESGAGTAQPSVRFDAGRLFVAFAGNPDLEPAPVRMRTTASQSLSDSIVTAKGSAPFLRIGTDGRARIVFRSAGGIRFGRARAVTGDWVTEPIPWSTSTSERPSLSIDEKGGIHAIWADQDGPSPSVRYSRRTASGTWTKAVAMGDGWLGAVSVDKPAMPWVAVGGAGLDVYRPVGGVFTGIHLADGSVSDLAIKVLDSGRVIVAWTRGSGLWLVRS
jgi:hypothetical protein